MNGKMMHDLIPTSDALDQYLDSLLYDDSASDIKTARLLVEQQQGKSSFIPDWAHSSFSCLLFNVSGLELAVPLDKTRGFLQWGKPVSSLVSDNCRFMGTVSYLNHEVMVIDTSRFLVGNERQYSEEQDMGVQHLIFVNDARYALAVDDVDEIVTFDAEDIRWRQGASKRPWYIGISQERRCALLDIDILLGIIKSSSS